MISSRKVQNVMKAVNLLKKMGYSQVHGCKCHVGIDEDRTNLFREAVSTFGRIDIFVSNAAVSPVMGKILECPESVWDKIFDINVRAPFLMVKEVVPIMKKFRNGSVILISSVAGYNPMRVVLKCELINM